MKECRRIIKKIGCYIKLKHKKINIIMKKNKKYKEKKGKVFMENKKIKIKNKKKIIKNI